tara:strand:+ start:278 stop:1891 length:1614 start_codon:yes stop_codon:yes gene_type:complete
MARVPMSLARAKSAYQQQNAIANMLRQQGQQPVRSHAGGIGNILANFTSTYLQGKAGKKYDDAQLASEQRTMEAIKAFLPQPGVISTRPRTEEEASAVGDIGFDDGLGMGMPEARPNDLNTRANEPWLESPRGDQVRYDGLAPNFQGVAVPMPDLGTTDVMGMVQPSKSDQLAAALSVMQDNPALGNALFARATKAAKVPELKQFDPLKDTYRINPDGTYELVKAGTSGTGNTRILDPEELEKIGGGQFLPGTVVQEKTDAKGNRSLTVMQTPKSKGLRGAFDTETNQTLFASEQQIIDSGGRIVPITKGFRITTDTDGNVSFETTSGSGSGSDLEKPVKTQLQKDIIRTVTKSEQINRILNRYEKQFATIPGELKNKFLSAKERFSPESLSPRERDYLKRFTRYRRDLGEYSAKSVNELFGAALSQGESERANTFLPKDGDSPTQVYEKLRGAQQYASELAAKKIYILQTGTEGSFSVNDYRTLKTQEIYDKLVRDNPAIHKENPDELIQQSIDFYLLSLPKAIKEYHTRMKVRSN